MKYVIKCVCSFPLAALIVLAGCGDGNGTTGPEETSYEGTWTRATNTGRVVDFTVQNNTITTFSVAVEFPVPPCELTVTSSPGAAITKRELQLHPGGRGPLDRHHRNLQLPNDRLGNLRPAQHGRSSMRREFPHWLRGGRSDLLVQEAVIDRHESSSLSVLRVTDVEKQPFRSMGFVSVIIVSALFALGLPLVLL